MQCCGSGRFLTGSGSDFRKRSDPDPVPDPDPEPNKFSANFFLKFFLMKICSKTYLHDQKVKQHRFRKYLWLLNTPKKFIQSHLLRPGSGSGSGPRRPDPDPDPNKKVRIRPDPTGSGSATLVDWV
jgi:hypothetical protein